MQRKSICYYFFPVVLWENEAMYKELWNFCTARQRTDMELSFYPGQNDFLATLSDNLGYIKTEGYKNPKALFAVLFWCGWNRAAYSVFFVKNTSSYSFGTWAVQNFIVEKWSYTNIDIFLEISFVEVTIY